MLYFRLLNYIWSLFSDCNDETAQSAYGQKQVQQKRISQTGRYSQPRRQWFERRFAKFIIFGRIHSFAVKTFQNYFNGLLNDGFHLITTLMHKLANSIFGRILKPDFFSDKRQTTPSEICTLLLSKSKPS